jgi:cell division protein FtsL
MVRRKYSRREVVLVAGCLIFAISTLTFYIWHQAALISLGYKMSRAEQEIRGLEENIKKLETEKAALLSLDKVERTARQDLHLTDPKDDQIIYEDFRHQIDDE